MCKRVPARKLEPLIDELILKLLISKVPRVNPDEVLKLHYQGKSRNVIAKHFFCSGTTISKVLKS